VIERYVNDAAAVQPLEFEWGRLLWLVNDQIAADAELTVGICIIEPGQRNGEHLHPNCEEALYVLEGECDHWLGDEVAHLTAGMMIRCPAHLSHYAVNTGDVPMKALVCFNRADRKTEQVEGGAH